MQWTNLANKPYYLVTDNTHLRWSKTGIKATKQDWDNMCGYPDEFEYLDETVSTYGYSREHMKKAYEAGLSDPILRVIDDADERFNLFMGAITNPPQQEDKWVRVAKTLQIETLPDGKLKCPFKSNACIVNDTIAFSSCPLCIHNPYNSYTV